MDPLGWVLLGVIIGMGICLLGLALLGRKHGEN